MRILCDEQANEADRGVRQEEVRGQTGTSRPQRARNMPARLQECMITSDDKGELVYYALYADIEPINVIEELKDSKWMHAMMEELKSIKVNKT